MRKHIGLVIILSVLSTACSQQLKDYVQSGPTNGNSTVSSSNSNPIGIRITPGANTASGTTVKSQFAITTSNKPVQGTQLKGTISFHQSRPE